MIIQTIYLLSLIVSIGAMWPQIQQLLRTKQSDEFNLGTWVSWMGCQVIALVYGVSIRATAYVIVSIVWIAFYVVIISLIVKYREPIKKYKQHRANRTPQPVLAPIKVVKSASKP